MRGQGQGRRADRRESISAPPASNRVNFPLLDATTIVPSVSTQIAVPRSIPPVSVDTAISDSSA